MNNFQSIFTLIIILFSLSSAQTDLNNWSYVGGQEYHAGNQYSARTTTVIEDELGKIQKELGVMLWEHGVDTLQFIIPHSGKPILFDKMWPVRETLHNNLNTLFSRMSFTVQEDRFLTTVVTLIRRARKVSIGFTPVHHEMPRSNEEISKFISRKRGSLKRIFRKSHNGIVAAANDLTLQISIAESGSVTSCHILDNDYVEDVEFEEDILADVSKWKFREVNKSLGDMVIKLPLTFEFVPSDYNNPGRNAVPIFLPIPSFSRFHLLIIPIPGNTTID